MEAIHLDKLNCSFEKQTTIAMAQDLQVGLMAAPNEQAQLLGYEAIAMMGDPETLDGLKKVYIHAIGAMILTSGFVASEVDTETGIGATKFSADIYMRGEFSKFAFVEFQSFRSLCVRMLQPEFIGIEADTISISKRNLRDSCVYIPVTAVETVLAA